MQCPRCQHHNPPQAKFCLECGGRLAPKCTQCGTQLPGGAKFCPVRRLGFAECPVYRRDRLRAGQRITGPAVIEQFDATTFLGADEEAAVDDIGFLVVRAGPEGGAPWTA